MPRKKKKLYLNIILFYSVYLWYVFFNIDITFILDDETMTLPPKRRHYTTSFDWGAEPNISLRICTHTQTIIISIDLCPPMLFKLRPCIQKLCNVYYSPTPSLGWIGQIKGRSLSLASTRSASWLAYSVHPRSLTPIWSWVQECTKPMPTHAHPWTITSYPCPPKTHGYRWAWAWAWVWTPNIGPGWGGMLMNVPSCSFRFNIPTSCSHMSSRLWSRWSVPHSRTMHLSLSLSKKLPILHMQHSILPKEVCTLLP